MSFLMPLYIAGAATIAFPIIFHLIRRTPRGQIPFSTLMFLRPSPPRLTRRSRLDNLFLLLLRAFVLFLIAFAFARPFFRGFAAFDTGNVPGRRMAILIDTSASMRRPGLWAAALEDIDQTLSHCDPSDQLAVMTFDQRVRSIVTFDETNKLTNVQRRQLVRQRVDDLAPTWHATDLDRALVAAAETLESSSSTIDSERQTRLQVILITDMQRGARLDGLQSYQWPRHVRVDLHRLAAARPGNAGLQVIDSSRDNPDSTEDEALMVRIGNASDTLNADFALDWTEVGALDDAIPLPAPIEGLDDRSPASAQDTRIDRLTTGRYHVPPGESRVVRAPPRPVRRRMGRLVLSGDPAEFDNCWYIAVPSEETTTVTYVGDDDAETLRTLRFYLERVFSDEPFRRIQVETRRIENLPNLDNPILRPLVVLAEPTSERQSTLLNEYVRRGGTLLIVLSRPANPNDSPSETRASLRRLLREPELRLSEGAVAGQYVMLRDVNFRHRLFEPFADPQYSDFTKIHFWHYRKLILPQDSSANRLASFETNDPFLVEQPMSQGRIYVMTSGWQSADSELALSSKFPPLMTALVSRHSVRSTMTDRHYVGDPVRLRPEPGQVGRELIRPDGKRIGIESSIEQYKATDTPGLYTIVSPARTYRFAVNIDPRESHTDVRDVDELEQLGVVIGTQPTRFELADERRALHDVELEKRQHLWQWLLVGAIVLLLGETLLAGRLGRRAMTTTEVATNG